MTNPSVTVRLSCSELLMSAQVGVLRQALSVGRGLPDKHGISPEDGWRAHIEGACGEFAVAKCLGVPWSGSFDTFRTDGDILERIEIKTRSDHGYDLLVRDDDDDVRAFVLVTGIAPNYVVRGWLWGREAKQRKWRQAYAGRPTAYFVPQDELRPLGTLLEELKANPAVVTDHRTMYGFNPLDIS